MHSENEILRLPAVLRMTGMGRTWTYAAVKRGEFPAPIKLGASATGWRCDKIEAWIEYRERAA